MDETQFKKFLDLLRGFDTAMLVTRREDGELRSRPMSIADCTDAAHLWFVTSTDTGTIDELTEAPRVNVALQSDGRYLSISGTARATRDPARIEALWSEYQRVWFEKGRDDPSLILIEIVPTYAEYWDTSGVAGMKFLFEAAKAYLSGETLDGDDAVHGKLPFPDKTTAMPDA